MSLRRTTPCRRRGSAVLDTALVLPVLIAMTFGSIEFGYYAYVKHNLQAAAREGSRAAILPTASNASVTAVVSSVMTAAGLQSSGYTTAITDTSGNAVDVAAIAPGTSIKITVRCTWGAVGVRPLGIISASKPLVCATVMRKEG